MAGPGISLDFKEQIKQIRKSFATMKTLQREHQKRAQDHIKVEKKADREDMTRLKGAAKLKDRESKKEATATRKRRQEQRTEYQQEKRQRDERGRFVSNSQRQEQTHIKKINDSVKRGPLGRGGKALKRVAAFGAGGAMGMLLGAAIRGYRNYTSVQQTMGQSIGMGNVRGSGAAGGRNFGFNQQQRVGLSKQMGRAGGVMNAAPMMRGMRATGMDAGELAAVYKTMDRGGTKFAGDFTGLDEKTGTIRSQKQGGTGQRQLAKMIEAGFVGGLNQTQLPQFFKSVTQIQEQQMQMMSGDVGTRGISNFLSQMNRFGKNKGLSGFQKERGGALVAQMDSAVRGATGDNADELRMALGFGTKGTDWYTAERKRQGGILGGEGGQNFQEIMDHIKNIYGRGNDAAKKIQDMGLAPSMDIADKLIELSDSGMTQADQLKEATNILKGGKSLKERAENAMVESGTHLEHMAKLFDDSVSDGATARDGIIAMEKLQRRLLDYLKEQIPVLAKGIGELVGIAKAFAVKWSVGDDLEEVQKRFNKKGEAAPALEGMLEKTTDPTKRADISTKLAKIYAEQSATMSGATGTDFLDAAAAAFGINNMDPRSSDAAGQQNIGRQKKSGASSRHVLRAHYAKGLAKAGLKYNAAHEATALTGALGAGASDYRQGLPLTAQGLGKKYLDKEIAKLVKTEAVTKQKETDRVEKERRNDIATRAKRDRDQRAAPVASPQEKSPDLRPLPQPGRNAGAISAGGTKSPTKMPDASGDAQ